MILNIIISCMYGCTVTVVYRYYMYFINEIVYLIFKDTLSSNLSNAISIYYLFNVVHNYLNALTINYLGTKVSSYTFTYYE